MDSHEPSFTPALSAITLLVADQETAAEFYARAFAEEPLWRDEKSIGFGLGSVVLNLLVDSEGERLLAPAPVAAANAGVRSQLSIWVDDIDTVVETLKARNVTFDSAPTDQPWGMRTVTFRDPDGHSWEIAQDLGG
ncbi:MULTISPECIES: VOC family protein [unclassified Luteococcus]|uniref:VOC family protein n=1 Tax=unclassified Luteococcus TaxID=2639923 RepID=UPI00313C8AD9